LVGKRQKKKGSWKKISFPGTDSVRKKVPAKGRRRRKVKGDLNGRDVINRLTRGRTIKPGEKRGARVRAKRGKTGRKGRILAGNKTRGGLLVSQLKLNEEYISKKKRGEQEENRYISTPSLRLRIRKGRDAGRKDLEEHPGNENIKNKPLTVCPAGRPSSRKNAIKKGNKGGPAPSGKKKRNQKKKTKKELSVQR